MSGVMRIDLRNHQPVVEYREDSNRYFVVYPDLKVELVMGFENKWTARELAINTFHGSPFYTMIPVVPRDCPYPRPWLVYPKLTLSDVEMRIR